MALHEEVCPPEIGRGLDHGLVGLYHVETSTNDHSLGDHSLFNELPPGCEHGHSTFGGHVDHFLLVLPRLC